MKLYDAIRNDTELRDDFVALFEAERLRVIQDIEVADPHDGAKLSYCKAKLDVLRQLRFTLLKDERNSARAHRP